MGKKAIEEKERMVVYPLRLPEPLKQWLQHKAAENRRSLNAEVVITLEQVQKQAVTHAA